MIRQADIVLVTLNARYSHSSFGLRYLFANLAELRDRAAIIEFTIADNTLDMLAEIFERRPLIVGFGVYIWNVEQTTRLVSDLKRARPDLRVVLGGPEVSYETGEQRITSLADFVITGEADLAFADLCRRLLARDPPSSRVIAAPVPAMNELVLPYDEYSADDIAQRVIYVEASRGCPFTCEFCLSALEIPVRQFDVDRFLAAMQSLIDRGARQFKFVDRTFNLNLRVSQAILRFFLDRVVPGLFLHFEMIPDRLPESLRSLIAQFPPGVLQFEIGVQTFNDQAGQLISRHQDNTQLEQNFRFLRSQTGVHLHADLIVGLPGESFDSFAAGFDRLWSLRPHEIQVGILKRLRGTPITRHDDEWQMVWSPHPPYEILSNRLLTFEQIHTLRAFARYWDLIGNSGHFPATLALLLPDGESAFHRFLKFCEWVSDLEPRRHGIALVRLFERLFEFITSVIAMTEATVAAAVWSDYLRQGRRDRPEFLRRFDLPAPPTRQSMAELHSSDVPKRQARHRNAPDLQVKPITDNS